MLAERLRNIPVFFIGFQAEILEIPYAAIYIERTSNEGEFPVKFHMTCPHCGNRMETEEEWIGESAKCPICRTEIVIQKNNRPSTQPPPSSSAASAESVSATLPVAGIVFLYLFMLIPFVGILTFFSCVILSFIQFPRHPEKTKKLLRHTLIATLIAVVTTLALTSYIFFSPPVHNAQEKGTDLVCLSNIKQILLAARMYSGDSDGALPDQSGAGGFEILRKSGYLSDPQVFVCPLSGVRPEENGKPLSEDHVSYLYIGGFRENDDPEQEVIFCPCHRNCIPVGCIDGTVRQNIAEKRTAVHEILEKAGILKRFDEFPDSTRQYIRNKMEE